MKKVNTTKINTTNDWGFGGWIGTRTEFENNIFHDVGKWYHSHTTSTNHEKWYVENEGTTFSILNKPTKDTKVLVLVENPTEKRRSAKFYSDTFRVEEGYSIVKTIQIK